MLQCVTDWPVTHNALTQNLWSTNYKSISNKKMDSKWTHTDD